VLRVLQKRAEVGLAAALAASVVTLAAQRPASPARPDQSRFTPVTVIQPGELDEPMAFEVLPGGKVYVIERKGALKVYDPATQRTRVVATLPVNTKYTSADGTKKEAEEGLIGITLDPKFAENHFVYMLYAEPAVTKHVLARWELNEFDELVEDSKKVVLEYGTQREVCCHTGGGMTWDRNGNLLITVGDNTGVNFTSHTDERPGKQHWDDQRTAANTNDLRGKILRIHPEPDGTYTIPDGNLFAKDQPGTRPEIFAMGLRNPWRVSVDTATGYVYWGEVGPDSAEDSRNGPRGYDEFNQARKAGNFGWPYFVGDNQAYPVWNYAANQPGEKKDPAAPTNTSVNNTGLKDLPPAMPAFIAYPYALSPEHPILGTGARSATGGPIFHKADRPDAARPFPDYYEGKWLAADLSRGWIMAISMTPNGDFAGIERFAPQYRPIEAIDLKFGPDGDLYVLEYGSNWFRKSEDSKLVRLEYNAGNRAPVAHATASAVGGAAPLKVALSARGSADPDGDKLTYKWSVEPEQGGTARTYTTENVNATFDKRGVYFATLTVTDPAGESAETLISIVVGNTPPSIDIDIAGNKTFFFPDQPLEYSVNVTDKEDGVPTADAVAFSVDHVSDGFDTAWLSQGDAAVDATTRFGVAKALMAQSDCRTCHNVDSKSNGPAWTEVAAKYKDDAAAFDKLAAKIRAGGTGVWGDGNMPAHPGLSVEEARSILDYVMHVTSTEINARPLRGTIPVPAPAAGAQPSGKFIFRAVYTDKGAADLLAHTTERIAVRRSPVVQASSADDSSNMVLRLEGNGAVATMAGKPNGYLVFRNVDLTGIRELRIAATAPAREGFTGGTIEVRVGSLAGELLGSLTVGAAGVTAPTASQIQEAGGAPSPARPAAFGAIKLAAPTGPRDLFIVVRNFSAKPDDMVAALSTITFVR
jgi:cytochrome c